jgi:putative transposase
VRFSVETSVQPLPESQAPVGIDVGLSSFAALSDGSEIENPRLYQKGQKRLRRAQRRVARRKKGSHRRRKAVVLLRKIFSTNSVEGGEPVRNDFRRRPER